MNEMIEGVVNFLIEQVLENGYYSNFCTFLDAVQGGLLSIYDSARVCVRGV